MYTSIARCSSVVMEPPVYAAFPLPPSDVFASIARCSSVVMEPPVYAAFPLPLSDVFAFFPTPLFTTQAGSFYFSSIFFQFSSPINKLFFFNLPPLSRRLLRERFKAPRPFKVQICQIASLCSGSQWYKRYTFKKSKLNDKLFKN